MAQEIVGRALAAPRLARTGWQVTVIESAPALHNEGYMVDLFGSGLEAASRMGLLPELREMSFEFEAVRWVSSAGRTNARLPYRVTAIDVRGPACSACCVEISSGPCWRSCPRASRFASTAP